MILSQKAMSAKPFQLPKEALSADRSRFTVSSCVDRWSGPLTVHTFGAGKKAYYITVYANHSTPHGMFIEGDPSSDDFGFMRTLPRESVENLIATYNFTCLYRPPASVNQV